jgi:hypothetical protein
LGSGTGLSADPFEGLSLATGTIRALDAAVEECGEGPASSFDILVGTIAVDAIGGWETVQLRTSFIDRGEGGRFRDADETPDGHWGETPLTRSARRALEVAAALARTYDLMPLPPGVLALGLAWEEDSGAAKALLAESDLGHRALIELLQDELLDTRLEGIDRALDGEAAERGALRGDATTGVASGGPRVPPPGSSPPPLGDPGMRRLLEGAESRGQASAATGTWEFTRGDRLLKVYDLRGFDQLEAKRIEAQASVGLSLGDVPGAVQTLAVVLERGWLVVETPRLGESLAEHLGRVDGLEEQRLSAGIYADLLAGAAETLQLMHERGLVHCGIEAAGLLLDPAAGRLLVGELAIAGTDELSSSNRYWAPERYGGEVGPSVDQYALGVTARDVLAGQGAPPLTAPVHSVLQKATAPRPADRFPSVAEFGKALQAAVGVEAPRGLSDRVASLAAPSRAALAPTAIGVVASLVLVTALAPGSGETAELAVLTTLLSVVVMIIVVFGGVALAGSIRGRVSFASLRLARRPLLPLVAFLVLLFTGLVAIDDPDGFTVLTRSLLISYGGCALLAPARPEAGTWLVLLLALWERRRAWPSRRRRAISSALVLAAAAALLAPAAAVLGWGNFKFPGEPARDFSPLAPVWNFRDEVLTSEAAGPPALCRERAKVAAMVQSADPATNRSLESFGRRGTLDAFRVQVVPAGQGLSVWELLAPSGKRAGEIFTDGPGGNRLVVMISRDRPKPESVEPRSLWLYEVVWTGSEWRIAEYRACEIGAPGTGKRPAECAITNTTAASQVRRILALVASREGQG